MMASRNDAPRKISRASLLAYAAGSKSIYSKPLASKSAPAKPVTSKSSKPAETTQPANPPTETAKEPAKKPAEEPVKDPTPPPVPVEAPNPTADDEQTFTKAQDDVLLKLKLEESRSWKEIGIALGKPHWVIKNRFKEIKPAEEVAVPPKDGGVSKANMSKPKDKGKDKGNKGWKGKQQDPRPVEEVEEVEEEPAVVEVAQESGDLVELVEDDIFSADELILLSRLLHRDQRDIWPRIASAFFDKTGRKIHPLDIKEKLTGVVETEK